MYRAFACVCLSVAAISVLSVADTTYAAVGDEVCASFVGEEGVEQEGKTHTKTTTGGVAAGVDAVEQSSPYTVDDVSVSMGGGVTVKSTCGTEGTFGSVKFCFPEKGKVKCGTTKKDKNWTRINKLNKKRDEVITATANAIIDKWKAQKNRVAALDPLLKAFEGAGISEDVLKRTIGPLRLQSFLRPTSAGDADSFEKAIKNYLEETKATTGFKGDANKLAADIRKKFTSTGWQNLAVNTVKEVFPASSREAAANVVVGCEADRSQCFGFRTWGTNTTFPNAEGTNYTGRNGNGRTNTRFTNSGGGNVFQNAADGLKDLFSGNFAGAAQKLLGSGGTGGLGGLMNFAKGFLGNLFGKKDDQNKNQTQNPSQSTGGAQRPSGTTPQTNTNTRVNGTTKITQPNIALAAQPKEVQKGESVQLIWSAVGVRANSCNVHDGPEKTDEVIATGNRGTEVVQVPAITSKVVLTFSIHCTPSDVRADKNKSSASTTIEVR